MNGEFWTRVELWLAHTFGQRQSNGFYLWRGKLYP